MNEHYDIMIIVAHPDDAEFGVAGSVAVGKSTTARVLQALLARWSPRPKVDLVTTDGFLYPNSVLEREGLMTRKGFPESYDLSAVLGFLSDIKAGRRPVSGLFDVTDADHALELLASGMGLRMTRLPGLVLLR